jgi:exo-1,4-beta-D-glucosaminidase
MRSHPSLFVWMNGSDWPPPANVEQAYIKVLHEADWPNPYVSSSSAKPTSLTGASGVKMTGPYDYVPPAYWLTDTNRYGGAFGFNTETSPGPAIPLKSSLRKMIPPDHLWPTDDVWNLHAGAGDQNSGLGQYNKAMNAIYGVPTGLDDYVTKSQAMAYDGERAMFEAYARNKYASTGVIQWMLNNAWPSVIWHLYDYFLQPAGGYFGAKKACEPVHVQYSYDDRGVVVVNNFYHNLGGLSVTAALYDFDLRQKFFRQVKLDAPADSTQRALVLPEISPPPKVTFLKLTLQNSSGEVLSSNFYWLPSKPSSYDWDGTPKHAFYTAISTYEDLTMLNHLPRVRLEASATLEHSEPGDAVRVQLHNPSHELAFQIRLGIREVIAQYPTSRQLEGHSQLEVSGWNVDPLTIPLKPAGNDSKEPN